jgi:hypothetical protein
MGENSVSGHYQIFFALGMSTDLTIEGTGTIDGQGYMWWVREILQMNIHGRNNLVEIS